MKKRLEEYVREQKRFWNVEDPRTAKFDRIHTGSSGTEAEWEGMARADAEWLLGGIDVPQGAAILEIGCGIGRLLKLVAERRPGHPLVGVDVSERMIAFAKDYLKDVGGVSLHVNSGYDLSMVASGSVGFAYAFHVFLHLNDIDLVRSYFAEIKRTLRPDGVFRFNVWEFDPDKSFGPTPGGLLAKWSHKLGLRSYARHRWKAGEAADFSGNKFSAAELRREIAAAGFRAASIETRPGWPHLWATARN